jgi:hypothetical protein
MNKLTMAELCEMLIAAGVFIEHYNHSFLVIGTNYTMSVAFGRGNNCSNRLPGCFEGWHTDNAEVMIWRRDAMRTTVDLSEYSVLSTCDSDDIMMLHYAYTSNDTDDWRDMPTLC